MIKRGTLAGLLEVSDRKHLTSREVERLIEATKGSRNEARDRCLLLLMFRHGLRVSEACGLRLSQVNTESRVLHVARLKQGLSTTHPLRGDEIRAIKTWLTIRARMKPKTDAFFISERRGPISRLADPAPSLHDRVPVRDQLGVIDLVDRRETIEADIDVFLVLADVLPEEGLDEPRLPDPPRSIDHDGMVRRVR